jgi:hypothetical protein
MIAPLRTVVGRLSDVHIDARIEQDLYWRWHFADGEVSRLRSSWRDQFGTIAPNQVARIRTAEGPDGGGITEDAGPRCGPVYVPSGQHRYPEYDADLSGMRAYHRRRRIDVALGRMDGHPRQLLCLAYREPVPDDLLFLCPPTVRGPALCNLVPLTLAAERAWSLSRSVKTLRVWLARHAERAKVGCGDGRLLRELATAADLLLASAGREYAAARRGVL